jgi:elongation factor Ts
MADITAKLVNELRNKTGLGMMECKKALTESAGDVDKAIESFRKKGVKTSITERAATEGRVSIAISPDRKRAVAVEINCNTDFTAKSDPVAKIAQKAADKLLADPNAKIADDPSIKAEMVSVAQQTGENVQIGRGVSLISSSGTIGTYLYTVAGKGKIAVLMALAPKAEDDVSLNIGMHITALKPIALARQEVAPDLIAKEKEIALEQATASGKPQNIAEKIAEGKMNSFFAEKVLLDQEFVKPDVFKGSVANLLKSKGVTLEKYVRLEVGQ